MGLIHLTLVDSKELAKEDSSYLKICENRAILGPKGKSKKTTSSRSTNGVLSNSGNFARLVLGGKFAPNSETNDRTINSNSESRKVNILFSGCEEDKQIAAIAALSYWDQRIAKDDYRDYKEKALEFETSRNKFYSSIGINPAEVKGRPALTQETRKAYNEALTDKSVKYYEYHIAFKAMGRKKLIRSKTFRTLKRVGVDNLAQRLSKYLDDDDKDILSQIILEDIDLDLFDEESESPTES